MVRATLEFEPLLTSGEVAALYGVNVKTVNRWADDGKLKPIRTLGGHRRFSEREVRALMRPEVPPTMITTKQAAELLERPAHRIRAWAISGQLVSDKVNGRRRYSKDSVLAMRVKLGLPPANKLF